MNSYAILHLHGHLSLAQLTHVSQNDCRLIERIIDRPLRVLLRELYLRRPYLEVSVSPDKTIARVNVSIILDLATYAEANVIDGAWLIMDRLQNKIVALDPQAKDMLRLFYRLAESDESFKISHQISDLADTDGEMYLS